MMCDVIAAFNVLCNRKKKKTNTNESINFERKTSSKKIIKEVTNVFDSRLRRRT